MKNTDAFFKELVSANKNHKPNAICSVCSSNVFVLKAALEEGVRTGMPVLIEATANQVNQFGGYTGMLPKDFKAYVSNMAKEIGFDTSKLILGGDHLGPLTWSSEPAEEAMKKADTLVSQYAAAGFDKIHLDCSMRLGSDNPDCALDIKTVAQRAARLAKCAEAVAPNKPVYIIGSEVPIPGGATEKEEGLSITTPEDLINEYKTFEEAFLEVGLEDAWTRVVAIVVQPGVEFGDDQVFLYNPETARELTEAAHGLENIVLEGHSTDYQPASCLNAMINDGIGILKVGPALTFAVREALFALEKIEREMYKQAPKNGYSDFAETMERVMLAAPDNWNHHYHGDEDSLCLMRKFSLSDRCRYYMECPELRNAVSVLIKNIDEIKIPFGLMHQYLPQQADAVIAGRLKPTAENLIKENVAYVLRTYK